MRDNLILATDSYKISHWRQYPPGTTGIYSFFESRGGCFPETTFFGLQYVLRKHLEGVRISEEDILEAREFFSAHFGNASIFNEPGWRHLLAKHGGRLPVRIKAVPEGLTVPNHNVLMTIENTDPETPWVTNYLETLLCQIWYPSTVCTLSRAMRQRVLDWLVKTGDPSLIDFKVHDFGYRGSTSDESAGIGGAAHLVNFRGTDTLAGIEVARRYYGEPMAGYSIPAAEHSTITAWGRGHEAEAYANMLEAFPYGLVAVVSDSYDIFRACSEIWGGKLKSTVMSRPGTVVIRPDSGDPVKVVIKVLELLGQAFGFQINQKGYRVLDSHVRVIQGDGIDYEMLSAILGRMAESGWSADNLAFGSGGGLLQKVNRDTQKFAFKCSAVRIGSDWHPVFKSPVTDPGKNSKAGRMKLVCEEGNYRTLAIEAPGPDTLQTVFEDGRLLVEHSFDAIRKRALIA